MTSVREGFAGRETALAFAVLIGIGALWGVSMPLTKVAVSEGHRGPGILVWHQLLGALSLGAVLVAKGRGLPLHAAALRVYLTIALLGAVLPGVALFEAVRHLPAGVVTLLVALVPVFAYPMALALGTERFTPARLLGLALGALGVLILVLPDAGLPRGAPALALVLALSVPVFYALEGNYVARWGTAGLGPVQVLCGASVVGAILSLPVALLSGTFVDPRPPWGAPEAAIVLGAVLNAVAYTGYVGLVGRAGAVFAIQSAYLVTGFGVLASMVGLGERYSGWVWLALAAVMAGVACVQPRPALAPPSAHPGRTGGR